MIQPSFVGLVVVLGQQTLPLVVLTVAGMLVALFAGLEAVWEVTNSYRLLEEEEEEVVLPLP